MSNPRPRLLHNWATSLLTIAHKTYQQAENSPSPLGSITKTLASFTAPIIYPLENRYLSLLSYIDDRILSLEDFTMTLFPPSSYLFSMVNELALLPESFPKWYDEAIETLVSLIEPMLSKIGSTTSWEYGHDKDRMMLDIKCDVQEKKMVVVPKDEAENGGEILSVEEFGEEKKLSKKMEEEIKEVEETCKDIIGELEKMGMGNERMGEEKFGEELVEKEVKKVVEDQILDLFEESWGGQRRVVY
ncbi:uncharacterized protein A4U43_C04F19200 [Asparagus officinalis]|uniref:Uncharacterized protein n=1 Tax=Asparagus officinalis TaxID=4686 RepID=A0A5P1F247_ASPOF|nr:uncharacterized protein LOC109837580 [Asparagus officinalis]ONK72415.1 uncharacterized protein A4U43_C04F19200 [Asparagus officinalis]